MMPEPRRSMWDEATEAQSMESRLDELRWIVALTKERYEQFGDWITAKELAKQLKLRRDK